MKTNETNDTWPSVKTQKQERKKERKKRNGDNGGGLLCSVDGDAQKTIPRKSRQEMQHCDDSKAKQTEPAAGRFVCLGYQLAKKQ